MKRLIALVLLACAAPAAAVNVETANGNWSYLPLLQSRGQDHLSERSLMRVHEIVESGKCTLPGQAWRRTEVAVSFATHFNPDGSLNRLVLPKYNCPEVESLLGGMILQMIEKGDYRPTGANPDGWYRGELSFAFVD